ncbi:hypothetical protein BUALT_Bualt04G0027100 [Buddleja alternifolia]|uniref:SWIM-type domain-containing protein n=1 Tax=Buddleja alternifolia TaxID=168488 RepID=A0AAV6XM47_9LAMI|nr:hypothetical protein BUALT_Bualt04G0027100 [Buddleja alternifolia]
MTENYFTTPETNVCDFPDLNGNDEDAEIECADQCTFGELGRDEHIEVHSSIIEEFESRLAVGQTVKSAGDAYLLYCKYAHAKGFSVKKGDQRYFPHTKELQSKDFECSCEGVKDERRSINRKPVYQKPITRTGCKARLKVGREWGGEWKVTKFLMEHNHEMVASDQIHLLRSSRNISHAHKSTLEAMVNAGISPTTAFSYMESEAHGPQNLGFTRKDAFDYLDRLRRKTKIEDGDASALLQYFIKKSNKETSFYWSVQMGDDNRMMNFFFRDYRCMIDYEYFGDVVSVDTTYRTNRYDLICVPFVGINHHKQNVMFGLAFMSDETESSFEWLFSTFLESMNGKQPETVFTDQCQAMMNAVGTIFPCAHHRLCQWHINQNAPSHFGSLNGDSRFKELWYECMSHCDSEEEFEAKWRIMIDEYNFTSHKWLNGMYKLRRKWATAFSNDNSRKLACKGKSRGHTLLPWEPPMIVKNNPLLNHAANVYTLNMYHKFEEELVGSLSRAFELYEVGDFLVKFKATSHGPNSRVRQVVFDKHKCEVQCSCHKFETMGILCKHALKALDFMNVGFLPESYIKKRWTKNVRNRVPYNESGENGSGHVSEMVFVNQIMRSTYDLAMRCKVHEETRKMMNENLESSTRHANSLFEKLNLDVPNTCDDLSVDDDNDKINEVVVRNPLSVKSRGVTNARIRGHWDAKS